MLISNYGYRCLDLIRRSCFVLVDQHPTPNSVDLIFDNILKPDVTFLSGRIEGSAVVPDAATRLCIVVVNPYDLSASTGGAR